MSLSPLKFSFGFSVLVHGVLLGGAALLGKFERASAVVTVGNSATLELIAAPNTAPQTVTPRPVVPRLPAPITTLPPPPLSEVSIPQPAPEPAQVDAATNPLPVPIHSFAEPQAANPAVAGVVGAVVTTESEKVQGDRSSPTPGSDLITAIGNVAGQAKPDYLTNPEPEYPLPARRRGQEGLVLIEATVSSSGRATEISIKQSSGYALLDQAALKAVQNWRFEPARIGSAEIESKIEVPVRFRLTR